MSTLRPLSLVPLCNTEAGSASWKPKGLIHFYTRCVKGLCVTENQDSRVLAWALHGVIKNPTIATTVISSNNVGKQCFPVSPLNTTVHDVNISVYIMVEFLLLH